jgi:hypothetical protein
VEEQCNTPEMALTCQSDGRVVVPSTMGGQKIFHCVHRNLRHIPVMGRISAAGEHLTPFSVCSQSNDTVERMLKIQGFRMGVDFIPSKRSKPYMNSQLFTEYSQTVRLPYIE